MILLIDNYDSFSYNLYQYVGEIDPDIRVIRNDEMTVEEIVELKPRSDHPFAGPGRPEDAGMIIEVVKNLTRDPYTWRVPRASGDMRGIRCDDNLRQKAYARQAVEAAMDKRMPDFQGLPDKTSR